MKLFFALVALIVAAMAGCLLTGTVALAPADVWTALAGGSGNAATDYIVMETRLPAALTAALASMALAVAGLLMQTLFANALAGPSILGVSSGASLGVGLVMLIPGAMAVGSAATLGGALLGALGVMLVLMGLSGALRSSTALLIAGIVIGYLASSAISVLNFFAPAENVRAFVVWGLGSFGGVALSEVPVMAAVVVALTGASTLLIKPLNALLLGENYAASAGVRIGRVRQALLGLSGALTAAATAWCGPIAFVGLVTPHMARMATGTADHRRLLPATALTGAAVGLICQMLTSVWGARGVMPVNAITPLIGVPMVLYLLLRRRSNL